MILCPVLLKRRRERVPRGREPGARSGGDKYPILPFAGEISYRCFKVWQPYFWRPLKSPYEVSPVKVYLAHFSPPEQDLVVADAGRDVPVDVEALPVAQVDHDVGEGQVSQFGVK